LAQDIGANVVFVDLGGNRELSALVTFLPWVEETLAPRLCVVKSEALQAAAVAWCSGPVAAVSDDVAALGGLCRGADSLEQAGILPRPAAWWESLHRSSNAPPLCVPSSSGSAASVLVPNWYLAAAGSGFTRNPLRYPKRFTTSGLQICRPYNYQTCLKAATCPFDHLHCHVCGESGHVARHCPAGMAAVRGAADSQQGQASADTCSD